ncbi:hypothetical protein ACFSKU_02225 [Pontibacter silvestris]|uniref:Uncharacterized protein n=1 Tax=Pontibacter silvestris TaxID=2305183 RepID=A0ABW4WV77_9BACT|nr:hypothetical protein [Pontibacter silvestris]MCC9139042.1 hypothetical protein [Pontibacter silvestris]
MIDLQEFLFLSLDDRATAVWEQGTFLGVRLEGEYTLALYHMGHFFCEVWYNSLSDEIALIQGFTSATQLEPYLKQIELPQF